MYFFKTFHLFLFHNRRTMCKHFKTCWFTASCLSN